MGIEPFLISSSLNVVIAQRLVRKICPKCKTPIRFPASEEEEIFTELSKIPARSLPADINLARPLTFYKGQGCPHCEQSGYRGRLAIVEVMAITEEMKKIIADGQITNIDLVKGEFIRQGMLTMKQDGIIKAMRGMTTIEEMWNATKD
jgi:type II secretory ATPase GspE/PulE/Tfp pilus assembly ATPase PilB-like protein